MCYIIFTLHQKCSHKQYSNTFPCAIVRGAQAGHYADQTLPATKFLPDDDEKQHQQQQNPPAPACSKRHPIRPVNSLCAACKREETRKRLGQSVSASVDREFTFFLHYSLWQVKKP
jgi:hypothetical protein